MEHDDNEPSLAMQRFWFPWWPVDKDVQDGETYYIQTRMKHRQGEALLVDPGAHGDLCSDSWVRAVEAESKKAGRRPPRYRPLDNPVTVGGVGKGACEALEEVTVEIGIGGDLEEYSAPMLRDSHIPALLGIPSLRERRAVLDCHANKMYTVGVGGYRIALSPGSKVYELEESTGGHLMLPCTDYVKGVDRHMATESVHDSSSPGNPA